MLMFGSAGGSARSSGDCASAAARDEFQGEGAGRVAVCRDRRPSAVVSCLPPFLLLRLLLRLLAPTRRSLAARFILCRRIQYVAVDFVPKASPIFVTARNMIHILSSSFMINESFPSFSLF